MIVRADEADIGVLSQVIAEAFFPLPVCRWLIPDGTARRAAFPGCFGLTRSLYLKELYVAVAARRKGVSKLLMRHLHDTAIKCDCCRVEWTTGRKNADAQRFYAKLGVPVDESKLFYRVEGDELRSQASS